ncbi:MULTISPECIES: MarR family winged helix-turn-helix transcriptional regulator [unclassified Streptomyces]|uniref:MarR family winged helix-turn-helix transcriptional regulator n=1 Tax=unclassified Streptomyces TaxID=2593676 RepID=UPI0036EB133A
MAAYEQGREDRPSDRDRDRDREQDRDRDDADAHAHAGIDADIDEVTRVVLAASRLFFDLSARSLAAVGDRVTLPQFRLLAVLATNSDAKLVTLAERLRVNPSTAMRMLDRLIAAGFAEREVNPVNRRETVLRVTSEGRRLVEDVTAVRRKEIAAVVELLDPEQRTALIDALTAFTVAGGYPPEPGPGPDGYPLGWPSDLPTHHDA